MKLDGFAPDSNVEVVVGDPAVYVGTLRADADGRVEDELVVPEWNGNGKQLIRGVGIDSENTAVVASGSVDVSDGQPRDWLRWLLPVLNVGLFAAAAWFALRPRPDKVYARTFDAATVAGS